MKIKFKSLIFTIGVLLSGTAFALSQSQMDSFKPILTKYLRDNTQNEHISAVELSISPNRSTINSVAVGSSVYGGTKDDVSDMSLFQIGSISKSFTVAIILKLQEQGKLSLKDKVGKYFPQYKQWSDFTIEQLLNMTAGLPNYSDLSGFSLPVGQNLQTHFTPEGLLKIAYGEPLVHGYFYSNTDYILAGMIAAKVAKTPFVTLMNQMIKEAGLKNTYYVEGVYPHSVTDRMVSGYYYNLTDNNLNPLILSTSDPKCVRGSKTTDVKCSDMSWAGAAGGIVSNTADVTTWIRQLFTANNIGGVKLAVKSNMSSILANNSLLDLESIVSTSSGKPIHNVDKNNPYGFGLGVAKRYNPEIGSYYYYQGKTLGYRVLYIYLPKDPKIHDGNGLIITIGVNSQPVTCLNNAGSLVESIYKQYTLLLK